jgi:hypothetical protein
MARYHLSMHNDDKTRSEEVGIQALYNDATAVAFARGVIGNVLHGNINRYSDWSMDIAEGTRAVASIRFDVSADSGQF